MTLNVCARRFRSILRWRAIFPIRGAAERSGRRGARGSSGDGGEPPEPFVKENPYGVVVFDSTRRALRLLGGGFGMVLWVIIFGALYFIEANWGAFEYAILGGWAASALLVTGFV